MAPDDGVVGAGVVVEEAVEEAVEEVVEEAVDVDVVGTVVGSVVGNAVAVEGFVSHPPISSWFRVIHSMLARIISRPCSTVVEFRISM